MLRLSKQALEIGSIYNFFSWLISKLGYSKLFLFSKYLPYTPGEKILDLGCGPGTNSKFFMPNDYYGLDISRHYIQQATINSPNHQFFCGDFLQLDQLWENSFDIVLMSGLLHHLPDDQASAFINKAYSLLKQGGKLIAIENCVHAKQARLKKKIILLDRGEFVRDPNKIKNLAKTSDFQAQIFIEENLLLIPYTHCILACKK